MGNFFKNLLKPESGIAKFLLIAFVLFFFSLEFLPFLQKQIEIIKPKILYILGTTAAKAILSTPQSLGKLRGKWYEYKTLNLESPIDVLVSYHPAFLLRSPNYKKEAWSDLQMLQKKIK